MPITLNNTAQFIQLTGACTVEDAELLHGYLTQHPEWPVDAGECEYMHTAVIQSLIVCQPSWLSWPKPPHLNRAMQQIFQTNKLDQANH